MPKFSFCMSVLTCVEKKPKTKQIKHIEFYFLDVDKSRLLNNLKVNPFDSRL